MTRDEVEALVAGERPGWRVVDFIEINDESGPSFEVTIDVPFRGWQFDPRLHHDPGRRTGRKASRLEADILPDYKRGRSPSRTRSRSPPPTCSTPSQGRIFVSLPIL